MTRTLSCKVGKWTTHLLASTTQNYRWPKSIPTNASQLTTYQQELPSHYATSGTDINLSPKSITLSHNTDTQLQEYLTLYTNNHYEITSAASTIYNSTTRNTNCTLSSDHYIPLSTNNTFKLHQQKHSQTNYSLISHTF